MKRIALALVATTLLAAPALAAPPTAFVAQGSAVSCATADSPEISTPIKFYFANGRVRLEMQPAGGGPAVVLGRRGAPHVTMMDPAQKVAFVAPLQAVDDQSGMPSVERLLDIPGWQSELAAGGKKLPGTETIGTERCTVWTKTKGQSTFKVWMSNALELPMQLEGYTGGKARFRFTLTKITPGPQAASLFTVPAGYQTTQMTGDLTQMPKSH